MKSLSFFPILILGVSLPVMLPASGIEPVDLLTGNWSCESGPCSDEEISFSIEDGVQIFNSWLHARPSASGASWQLNGDDLVVECCAGLRYKWTIINITETELILREEGYDDDIVYKWIGE